MSLYWFATSLLPKNGTQSGFHFPCLYINIFYITQTKLNIGSHIDKITKPTEMTVFLKSANFTEKRIKFTEKSANVTEKCRNFTD